MTHESNKKTIEHLAAVGTLSLGAFSIAALAAAETRATHKDHSNGTYKADVISNIRPGEFSTFTVPGYHADGHILARNMDRHFEQMGTTHYAVHPERGFSLDSIREEWLKARALDGHRPARIYALSMGGLLVAKLFSDDEFRQEFGEVDKVVLDSALSGKKDLGLLQKLGMGFAALLPVTYSTGKFYHLVSGADVDGPLDHAPEVLREEVTERLKASARMHFSAGQSEILFMRHEDVANMNLSQFGRQVLKGFTYLASVNDNVLNTRQSARVFSEKLEQDVEYRIDTQRRLNNLHAGGPERPQGAVDALLDQNPDKYRRSTIRYMFPRFSPELTQPDAA